MNHHLRSAQVWHVFSRDLTVSPAHPLTFNPHSEWAIPAFAFPAIARTHLPTPEGWKAELAWVAGYIVRQFTCLKAVTHPSTNQAQCIATASVETTVFTTTLNRHFLPPFHLIMWKLVKQLLFSAANQETNQHWWKCNLRGGFKRLKTVLVLSLLTLQVSNADSTTSTRPSVMYCCSDKCWLPNVTLTALVQRELFPKAPMPIPITSKEADIKSVVHVWHSVDCVPWNWFLISFMHFSFSSDGRWFVGGDDLIGALHNLLLQ